MNINVWGSEVKGIADRSRSPESVNCNRVTDGSGPLAKYSFPFYSNLDPLTLNQGLTKTLFHLFCAINNLLFPAIRKDLL